MHNERLKQEWKSKRQVKPRRPLRYFNPDRPYPQEVFTIFNDALFEWPEMKEAFTTMGHAHHPDSSGDELNEIVDPVRRQLAKHERVERFAKGGSEIDLDLGNPRAKPTPQDIKRTFILADAGTEFDTPVIPLSKYLKGVWRYWEPTYVNACIGLRYWSYIAVSSTFVCTCYINFISHYSPFACSLRC